MPVFSMERILSDNCDILRDGLVDILCVNYSDSVLLHYNLRRALLTLAQEEPETEEQNYAD